MPTPLLDQCGLYLWPAKCRVRVQASQGVTVCCQWGLSHTTGGGYTLLCSNGGMIISGAKPEKLGEKPALLPLPLPSPANLLRRYRRLLFTDDCSSFSVVRNQCPAAGVTAGPVPSSRVITAIIHIAWRISSHDNARVIWNEVSKLPFYEGILGNR